jgi:protein-glutamine gamma-glutamyltransferase
MTEQAKSTGENATARDGIIAHRWLALAMLATEVGAIAFLSRSYLIPTFIMLVAIVGLLSKLRIEMARQRAYDAIALVGVVYIFNYVFLPENFRYQQLFASQQIAYNVALFSLTIQSLLFYVKRRDDLLPFMFPALGVVALACAAIVEVSLVERSVFQSMCVAFALIASLFCDTTRRNVTQGRSRRVGRPFVTALALFVVGFVGWYTATFLHRYEHQMDRFVRRFIQPGTADATIGFTESARLGSISLQKDTNSKQIALRVVSPVRPGYLRGRAFDVYDGREWLLEAEGKNLRLLNGAPQELEKSPLLGHYFKVGERQGQLNRFEVWPAFSGSYMAPLGCSFLHANSLEVTVDSHGIMRSKNASAGMPYSVYAQGSGPGRDSIRGIDTTRTERLTRVPAWARISPEIMAIADRIFSGRKTTTQKIDAVKTLFRDHFRYSLYVTVPPDYLEDPLKWFLLAKPPAHCEYFASGAALLLRLGGVRCRYVTGFVVEELNDFSGDWVARNKDAHAWVEAFDEEIGWLTVESTPSEGVPRSSDFKQGDQFSEYLKDRLQRLRMSWQQHGVRLIGQYFLAFVSNPAGAFVTFLAVVVLFRRAKRYRFNKQPKKNPRPMPDEVVTLNKSLQGIEKHLRKFIESRGAGETLHQFAQRLESVNSGSDPTLQETVSWLREYNNIRYQRARTNRTLEKLNQTAQSLIKQLRNTRSSS